MTEGRRERWIQGGLAGAAALLSLPVLFFPFGFDQAIYATIADVMRGGGRPYVDAWEMRPPAVFYLYEVAFALFGRHEWAIRVFDLIALAATAPALYRIGRDAFSRRDVGIAAALAAPLLYVAFGFWDTSQPESYMIPLLAWGLCFWMQGDRPLPAGLCFGAAILFKHSIALVPLAMAVALVVRDRRALLRFAAGVAAPVTLLVVLAFAQGYFGAMMRETLGYASHHATTNWRHSPGYLAKLFWWGLSHAISPVCLGVAAAGDLAGIRTPETRTPTRRVLLWGGVVFLTILLQMKFFVYHFLPLVPFLAILGALTLTWPRWWRYLGIAAVALLVGLPIWRSRKAWYEILPGVPVSARKEGLYRECSMMADQVRARTGPADKLFIWGEAPQVYFLSDRRPATRYAILAPAVVPWAGDERVEEIVARLRENPPPIILTVAHDDALASVTSRDEDSEHLAARYPAFRDFMRENYEGIGSTRRFTIWSRR